MFKEARLKAPILVFLRFLLALIMAASGIANASEFTERVAYADSLELRPEVLRYYRETIYSAIGADMGSAMRDCTSRPNASTETFVILLDIADHGAFENSAVEPKVNTATCFATAISRLRFSSPPASLPRPLTLGIKMTVKP